MKISDDADVERLSIAIAKALQQARSVSDSEHYDHHVWISARIKSAEAQRAFWEDMHKHIAKWGAISLLSCVGYATYLGMKMLLLRTA